MQLKVVAVSSNSNSFGLKQMLFEGDEKYLWSACANYINLLKVGDTIEVHEDVQNPIATALIKRNFELVAKHAKPSQQ